MKTIDLTTIEPSVEDFLDLAKQEGVIVRLPNGKLFFIASVADEETDDDFADEVARTRRNEAVMELLHLSAQEKRRFTSEEARKRLGI